MGAELDLSRSVAMAKNHDYIAAITRKDGKLEFAISASQTKVFHSNSALNDYLKALGLEEVSISL